MHTHESLIHCINYRSLHHCFSFFFAFKLHLKVALYHGQRELTDIYDVNEGEVFSGEAVLEHSVKFSIQLVDIPRMARLCFALYAQYDRRNPKGKQVKQGSMRMVSVVTIYICYISYNILSKRGSRKYRSENPILFWTFSMHKIQFFIADKNSNLSSNIY